MLLLLLLVRDVRPCSSAPTTAGHMVRDQQRVSPSQLQHVECIRATDEPWSISKCCLVQLPISTNFDPSIVLSQCCHIVVKDHVVWPFIHMSHVIMSCMPQMLLLPDLQGRLCKATRLKGIQNFKASEHGLHPIHLDVWGLFIWLYLGKEPECSVTQWLGKNVGSQRCVC